MIPVGDFLRRRTTPYVNWALIAVNVAVFVYTVSLDTRAVGLRLSEVDRFFFDWGFEPACVAEFFGIDSGRTARQLAQVCPSDGREPLQLFTSMFLHGGWAHIASNMLFLWIFGDNVEDRMGHARYLAFYLLCGIVAGIVQTALAIDVLVPTIGASGAIAGVLGAYLVLYPKAMVTVVILPLFFFPFVVPAVVLIGIWFVMQLFQGLAEVASNTSAGEGVAWWAHVGGFLAGALLVWFFRKPRRGWEPKAYGGFSRT